jgi:glc operon protein GlcG
VNTPVTTKPLEYGPPISLQKAKQVVAAAESEALKNGWLMVIAVVDSGGNLVLLERMDHAQYASVQVAREKAETAVNFKRPSKLFEDAVEAGGKNLRLLGMSNLVPLDGGIPLLQNGQIIGAIGVSGAQSQQDAQVAAVGVAALT